MFPSPISPTNTSASRAAVNSSSSSSGSVSSRRTFRARSRSFDGAFLSQLHAFHQAQMVMQMAEGRADVLPAVGPFGQPLFVQQHSTPLNSNSPRLTSPLASAILMPPRSGAVSPTQDGYPSTVRREKLLREAYCPPPVPQLYQPFAPAVQGNGSKSPRLGSRSSRGSSTNNSRRQSRATSPNGTPLIQKAHSVHNSPRMHAQTLQYNPSSNTVSNQKGFVALLGPMQVQPPPSLNLADPPMYTRSHMLPFLPQPPSGQLQRPSINHRMNLLAPPPQPGSQQSHIYGWIPTNRNAPPPRSASDEAAESAAAATTSQVEAPPAQPVVSKPHRRQPSTLLELHNEFVEVKPTLQAKPSVDEKIPETEKEEVTIPAFPTKEPSSASSSKRNSKRDSFEASKPNLTPRTSLKRKSEEGSVAASLLPSSGRTTPRSNTPQPPSSANLSVPPLPTARSESPKPPRSPITSPTLTPATPVSPLPPFSPSAPTTPSTPETSLAEASRQAQLLKDIQARKQRVKDREAATLAKISDLELERAKAEKVAASKSLADKARKKEKQLAMVEAARERARAAEAAKEEEEKRAAEELERREKEKLALARLRAPMYSSFFNPTLAYALKVESSHSKKRRTSGVGLGSLVLRERKESQSVNSTAGKAMLNTESEEKTNTPTRPNLFVHTRKPSLYDGSDWDELHSLDERTAEETEMDLSDGEESEPIDQPPVVEEGNEEKGDSFDPPTDFGNQGPLTSLLVQTPPRAPNSPPLFPKSPSQISSSSTCSTPAKSNHNRTPSSIAKEHIANQFQKISVKHSDASKQLQVLRKEKNAKFSAAVTEKQEKIDALKEARIAELKRMHATLAAIELNKSMQGNDTKVESFVLAMKLAKAAKEGDVEKIRALSQDTSETEGQLEKWVNRHDSAGSTAIFHATWVAAIPTLELLFQLGAQANVINNRRNTALHLACDRKHFNVIRLLIFNGANPLLKNHEKNAPFEMQSKNSNESLEMALYIRQCLEDFIVEKSPDGAHREIELGNGMSNTAVTADEEQKMSIALNSGNNSASTSNVVSPAETPVRMSSPEPKLSTPGDASPLLPVTPTTSAAVAAMSSMSMALRTPRQSSKVDSANATPTMTRQSSAVALAADQLVQQRLVEAKEYLAGINQYITARIQLSQTVRRAKMKLWSFVRFSRTMSPKVAQTVTESAQTFETPKGSDTLQLPVAVDKNANNNATGEGEANSAATPATEARKSFNFSGLLSAVRKMKEEQKVDAE